MTEDLEPIPDPDSIEVLTAVDRATLKKLTRFHTGAELSGLLLRAHNRVGRYLSGERDLPQREKMVVLQAAGISPWLYHELLRAELPEPSPAEILRQLCRDPNHVCADPFLIELEQALEGIRKKPIVDGPGFEGFAEELAEIEELQHVSLPLAREQLSAMVVAQLDAAISAEALSRTRLGQLALGLAVWGGFSRLDRNFPNSCEAYCHALELADLEGSTELMARLKHRAANLIADCGFMLYAKVWLKEAVTYYRLTGQLEHQGKAVVDLGRVDFHRGALVEAAALFEQALVLLPASCFRYRFSALETLSSCQQSFGDNEQAMSTLQQAFAEYGDRRDSFRGYLAWVQARLVRQAGQTAEAESLYGEAVDLLRKHGSALSPDLALLDFSEFRVASGRGTKDLGAMVMSWLKEGRYDSRTAQVAAKMVRVLYEKAPTLSDIADLRRQFEQVGAVTVPDRLK